jgi:hypothetical protein
MILPRYFRAQEEVSVVGAETNKIALVPDVFVTQRLEC